MHKLALTLASALLLGGCASWQPQAGETAPPALPAAYAAPLAVASPAETARWWAQFGDEQLARLVDRALADSRDLRSAAARIRESRALAALAQARMQPRLGIGATLPRDRRSENSRFGAFTGRNPATEYQLGFDAAWEVDLFGALGLRREAAEAELESVIAASGATAISVAGEVAATYFELRGAQAQVQALERLAAAAAEVQALTAARERAGLVPALDRLRAQEQVALIQAQLAPARVRAEVAVRRLGVLVGADSQALLSELDAPVPLPESLPPLPGALPATLLERRPDLVAAERQWAAALSRAAGAQADRLPKLSLGATLGLLSIATGELFTSASRFWSLGLALRAPLYDPALSALVETERARAEQAALSYEQAAIQAVFEVEDAALRASRARERETQLASALAADNEALALARIRYDRGLTDFLGVLDVVRQQLAAEQELIAAREASFKHYVALYKALGGGWDGARKTAER